MGDNYLCFSYGIDEYLHTHETIDTITNQVHNIS